MSKELDSITIRMKNIERNIDKSVNNFNKEVIKLADAYPQYYPIAIKSLGLKRGRKGKRK